MSDNVQIIDFGNSEFFFDDQKHIYCHFEGTLNYMPPEYFDLSKIFFFNFKIKNLNISQKYT